MLRYKLIRYVDERPCPCDYCDANWGSYNWDGVVTCHDSCNRWKRWQAGEIWIPPEFDKIEAQKFRKFEEFLEECNIDLRE